MSQGLAGCENTNNDFETLNVTPVANSTNEMSESNETDKVEEKGRKRKKKTSELWTKGYFKKQLVVEKINGIEVQVLRAVCQFCKEPHACESSQGTTRLCNHYNRCPKRKNEDNRQQLLQVSQKDSASNISVYKFDDELSQRKFAEMFILHACPFAIADHVGFRDFIKSINPSFQNKSRITVKKFCISVFEDKKKKLLDVFESLPCRVSLTMDKWTSCQNKAYLCITTHYLDDEWKLQKRIINFMHAEGRGTGDKLCEQLTKKVLEWNLFRKLFSLTVDNDSANDVAIKIMKLNLQKNLVMGGEFFHVRCAAHIINLVVQDGLKEIEHVIDKIRETVKFIKNSPQHQEKFEEAIMKVNSSNGKTLSLDVSTRWNSTYLMLKSALDHQDALAIYHMFVPKYNKCPSDEDWNQVKNISDCLKIFYDVTELFSGSKYPTSNHFFGEFCEIYIQLLDWSIDVDETITRMAVRMKMKFEKYWQKNNYMLAIACFLDPNYKMRYIEFYFGQLYGESASHEIEKVSSILKKLFAEYSSSCSSTPLPYNTTTMHKSSENDESDQGERKRRKFAQFLKQSTKNQTQKTKLDRYIDDGVIDPNTCSTTFNILLWWRANQGAYPILSRMARDILCVPISTVASESAFSDGGRMVDIYRSRLAPDTVEALMCTQDWLKAARGSSTSTLMDDITSEFDLNQVHGELFIDDIGTSTQFEEKSMFD